MRFELDARTLRLVVVACQAATIVITWTLWQVREAPSMLPLIEFAPSLPFGGLLLASLALVLRWPLTGAVVHLVLLTLAIAADQMREQPHVISLALLLCATLPLRGAREVGALHLVALWLWSGIGKLASPRFLSEGGAWLLADQVSPDSTLGLAAAIGLGAGELTLGLLALVPRTRRNAAWLGCFLHLGILVYLSPWVRGTNPGVWPWNLALAFAAPTLLAGRLNRSEIVSLFPRSSWVPRVAGVLFVVLPLGDHAGLVDAPFGHRVYTHAGPHALLLRADGTIDRPAELPTLHVSIPPVPRILSAWFERVGRPGDRLLILEERRLARALGLRDRMFYHSSGEHP